MYPLRGCGLAHRWARPGVAEASVSKATLGDTGGQGPGRGGGGREDSGLWGPGAQERGAGEGSGEGGCPRKGWAVRPGGGGAEGKRDRDPGELKGAGPDGT